MFAVDVHIFRIQVFSKKMFTFSLHISIYKNEFRFFNLLNQQAKFFIVNVMNIKLCLYIVI